MALRQKSISTLKRLNATVQSFGLRNLKDIDSAGIFSRNSLTSSRCFSDVIGSDVSTDEGQSSSNTGLSSQKILRHPQFPSNIGIGTVKVVPGLPNITLRRKYMIDTLALVKRLEGKGLSAQQAEGITSLVSEITHESMEDIALNFITKQEMKMTEVIAETSLSRFKNEIKNTQEQNFESLRRETERLSAEIERLRSELKYELDKILAGQRLDLNLEKGRMREELQQQIQETSNLGNKLDKEVNSIKADMEAAKFDVIKYCVGTLVSVSAVGLGLLRILM